MEHLVERLRVALGERYAVEEQIGEGGMALVFRALDQKHGRAVAIKVLRPEIAAAMGPDRFLGEIALAARLQHPHILPLIDSGESAGLLHYVMPYLEGETLADRIAREGPLPLDDVLSIASELASAVGYAHSQGIQHRDIKPANLMLTRGHLVVMDFGIARLFGPSVPRFTEAGILVGTPAYMAPELLEGGGDPRSDIYAIGCVLYELLIGAPPFTGPSSQALLVRHASQPVPDIAPVRPEVPPRLEALVLRALEKSPDDRFPDLASLERELKAIAAGAAPTDITSPRRSGSTRATPTRNLEAYDLYLSGIHSFDKRTAAGNLRAIDQLERAVRLDPSFGLAFATLAEAYIEQFFTHDPAELWEEKAFVAIERARGADPDLANIYVAKGKLLWTRARHFPHLEALSEYRRALALDSDSVEGLNELARVLWHIGQLDPAVTALERALALKPEFIDGRFRLAWLEQHRGNYQRSLELLHTVPEGSLRPSVECVAALTLLYLNRGEEARECLATVPTALQLDPDFSGTDAIFQAIDGDAPAAERRIAAASEAGKALGHFHHVEYNIAAARALLGQTDLAIAGLRSAAEHGFPCYPWFARDPLLSSIRADPRFLALIEECAQRWAAGGTS